MGLDENEYLIEKELEELRKKLQILERKLQRSGRTS